MSVSTTPKSTLDAPNVTFEMTYPAVMGPNDLTTSGLLYEGSVFTEWERRAFVVMRSKLLDRVGDKKEPTVEDFNVNWFSQVVLIHGLVSNALLARIPTKNLYRRSTLWKNLASLAIPFRLTELSEHVRQQIFKLALPLRFDIGAAHHDGIVPALLQVSSHVRKETLPLLYSCTTSEIGHKLFVERPEYVKSWVERIVGENTRHVRRVRLCSQNDIDIEYSDSEGLMVDMNIDESHRAVRDEIKAQVEEVEHVRSLFRLKGEAIFLALWRDADIWKEWTVLSSISR